MNLSATYIIERGLTLHFAQQNGVELDVVIDPEKIISRLGADIVVGGAPLSTVVREIVWFPLFTPGGELIGWICRPLPNIDPKRKFLCRINGGSAPYIHRSVYDAARGQPLIITEGPVKALVCAEASCPAIGLNGVWCAQATDEENGKLVLRPEIKTALDLRSRKVCIAFDADAATNPDVRHAMVRLYLLLTAAGADVYQLTSWDLDKGKGIDDYLVRQALAGKNGTRPTDALRMLIDDAAPFCDTLRPTPYDLQIVARELGRVQLPPALRDQLCKSLAKQLKVSVEELRTAASQHQSALPEEQDGVTGALDKLNIWFDPDRNCFWRPNNRAMWIKGSHGDVELLLRHEGWSEAKPKGGGLSDVQLLLSHIQSGRDVQYAGALAGHRKGQIYCGDNRILVVKGPLLIEPREIPWPILTKFLCGLLGLEQLRYLHGWLKVALESLYQGRIRPGQALVMAGPRDCGKSLLQSLITQMLGGRMARPYAYMAALTPFNGHLFEAEHLPIEDEQPYTDIRARRNFGVKIKEITGIEVQNCHAKYRPAISLPVFWRLSISTNDERENLMILPPLDDSLQDKLIIFKAQCCPMPMPTATIAERQLFWDTLVSELPGYIHYLFNRWVIEEQLVSQRYGITHFHHSEIVSHLQELAPEMRLLELIDAEVFKYVEPIGRRTDPWKGSSMELEKVLTDSTSSVSFQARQLLCWQGACGTYLRRLKNLFPTRITFTTPHGVHRWTIESPKN